MSYNIYFITLTRIANQISTSPALLERLASEGVKVADVQEIAQRGEEANAARLEQRDAYRRLALRQDEIEALAAMLEAGISRIYRLKPLVVEDLTRALASKDDISFASELSCRIPPAPKKAKVKRRMKESRAYGARCAQVVHLVQLIDSRPSVAAAFAERQLDLTAREELWMTALLLAEARAEHNATYNAWLAAGLRERAAIAAQQGIWIRISRFVRLAARTEAALATLLTELATARKQAKTGGKRGPRKPKAPTPAAPTSA
jgi:hypothetical protein